MNRETVGKLSSELLVKQVDDKHSAHEQMLEQLSDYEKNFIECLEIHKKIYPIDFYIVVITKRERLLTNVLRNYFTARLSCPTPDYDQTVYHYNRKNDSVEYLWTIPDKKSTNMLYRSAMSIAPEEHQLLAFVVDFKEGRLLNYAKNLNGEEVDSPMLVKGNY